MAHVPTGRADAVLEAACDDGDEVLLALIPFDVGDELVYGIRRTLDLLEDVRVVSCKEPADAENAVAFLAHVENAVERVDGVDFTDVEEAEQVGVLVVIDLFHDAVLEAVHELGGLVQDHEHDQVEVGVLLEHQEGLELDYGVGLRLVDARAFDEESALVLLVASH